MDRFQPWHHRLEVTSEDEARQAVETFRREASWTNVPAPLLARELYEWFRRGWCLAAIRRAWEITPNDTKQRSGDPDADPVGTLRVRLKAWRDGLGVPKPPPIEALSHEQLVEIAARRDTGAPSRRPVLQETRERVVAARRERETDRIKTRRRNQLSSIRSGTDRHQRALAELDQLLGAPMPPLWRPEDTEIPAHKNDTRDAIDRSEYAEYFKTTLARIRKNGLQSLPAHERAVFVARWRGIRSQSGLKILDDLLHNPDN